MTADLLVFIRKLIFLTVVSRKNRARPKSMSIFCWRGGRHGAGSTAGRNCQGTLSVPKPLNMQIPYF